MRVFEQSGGDMRKVNTQDIRDAEAKIKPLLSQVLPAGDGFSERAKAVEPQSTTPDGRSSLGTL